MEKNYIMAGFAVANGSGIAILRNYTLYLNLNTAQNVLMSNNIFVSENPYGNCLTVDNSASAMIMNNIFFGKVGICNSVFRNNICTCTTLNPLFTVNNCVVENNLGASTQFGTINGNQQNVDMNTVFMNTGSSDGKYRLKSGSPAIAAGVGGAHDGGGVIVGGVSLVPGGTGTGVPVPEDLSGCRYMCATGKRGNRASVFNATS